ncbi:MAG: hypothetical protein PXX83_07725 [Candidatus Nitrosotalea sp.]|nr:hypothetical protein [Candidatus Nitrosotalea sp.]
MSHLQKSGGDKTIGVWRNSKHENKIDVTPGKMTDISSYCDKYVVI